MSGRHLSSVAVAVAVTAAGNRSKPQQRATAATAQYHRNATHLLALSALFNALRSRHFPAPPQPHTSTPDPLSCAAALALRADPARPLGCRVGCSGGAANPGRAEGWMAGLAG